MSEQAQPAAPETKSGNPAKWGTSAPTTVLQRVLKEGSKVPLFLGQTLVNSLRDVGYNDTTSAVCEHIDNALQWGAKTVRVYFNERKDRGASAVDVLVLDDGQGMSPAVLQVATAFGGSMVYQNRQGIGRFGVGMKAAALSMSPVLEIYSWQEPRAYYQMTLDVFEISNDRRNLIELPEPEFMADLPSEVAKILTKPLIFPKNPNESQKLVAENLSELHEALGPSGTIVFMPDCDRLTYKSARTLVEHATDDIARIYRRYLERGVKIYINNREVEAFDPTYWSLGSRHTRYVADLAEHRSRLVRHWDRIEIPVQEGETRTAPVSVRLYRLPIEDWEKLGRKVLNNNLHVYSGHIISFMRADREVHAGSIAALNGKAHQNNNWLRIQIDFPAELDEAMGVAMNKQGVRPKRYVLDAIANVIEADVSATRQSIAQSRPERIKKSASGPLTEAERRANAADPLQAKPLPAPAPQTEEEQKALEENLRTLAMTLRRDAETEDQAFERIKTSTYVTHFVHDQFWPFYNVDYRFGKVILTINTDHPFYDRLYKPLVELSGNPSAAVEDAEDGSANCNSELVIMLQLLLLSLARAQSQLTSGPEGDDRREVFGMLQKEWTENLRTQMRTA
jgi:hypothetical protein